MIFNEMTAYGLTIISLLLILFSILTVAKYKKQIEEKNIRLIQHHLDIRFLSKNLIDSLKMHDKAAFCSSYLAQIKKYYHLDEIIIIDSVKTINAESNSNLRKFIIDYVKQNVDYILENADYYKLTKFEFNEEGALYDIYLSKTRSKEEDGLIICVENTLMPLNSQEKDSLENNMNLLKNRLFYI